MKDRTESQKQASRRNGALSHGPATPEGKQASSQNASKHGFTAATIKLLPHEDPAEFEAFVESQMDRFHPWTDAEAHLVRDFAAAAWRVRAISNAQIEFFSSHLSGQESFPIPFVLNRLGDRNIASMNLLMRYAASLQRQYTALLKELTEIQKTRATKPARLRNEPAGVDQTKDNKPLEGRQPGTLMHPGPPSPESQIQPNM